MKKQAKEFLRRGAAACGLGPIVLAILYLILQHNGAIESLTVNEVCVGIFSFLVFYLLFYSIRRPPNRIEYYFVLQIYK